MTGRSPEEPAIWWEFAGRHGAGPVPPEVAAAVAAALQTYLESERAPISVAPVNPWGLAGRREAVGEKDSLF